MKAPKITLKETDAALRYNQHLRKNGDNLIVQEILERTQNLLNNLPTLKENKPKAKKERKPKERKTEVSSGKGYVYTYDSEGKPIPKSRVLMEKKLGRPLHKFEVIVYLDGDRRNCELENLEIGFRQNAPKSRLKCEHCGTVGEVSFLLDVDKDSPDYQHPTS